MGNHTETTQIDFLPNKISYKTLLEIFWSSHTPSCGSVQYRSAVFYHNEEQKAQALAVRKELELNKNRNLKETAIEPCGVFTLAEDYHQKYYLRSKHRLMNAIQWKSDRAFLDSTLAARLNAVAGRHGVPSGLVAEAMKAHDSPIPSSAQQEIDVLIHGAAKSGKRAPGC